MQDVPNFKLLFSAPFEKNLGFIFNKFLISFQVTASATLIYFNFVIKSRGERRRKKMEVVPMNLPRRENPAGSVGLPFNKRNVEEWSRLDRLTGIMETAKIETDHWAARSNNAAHKYGKVSITLLLICQMGSLI